ncbi:hypothetical protein PP940_gp186 [Rhizobium phage RL2RES]|uniref:Uncharacterized protein n=1 Tax=Rhizobium phage RL2RES TaxID=103371 RepID=A0A6B9J238_9CAUD|nr:hypothetical protein PP940_gp186 [Rhizobium phage RL2RES]QGZ14310.1 hypothetical protein RL2RES_186 [Rhizobium phage RL2RES]
MKYVILEDLKQINVANSDDAPEVKEEWEYLTTSHGSVDDAEKYNKGFGWIIDESIQPKGIIDLLTHVERHWKRKKVQV